MFHPDARRVGQPLAPELRELLRGPSGSVSLRLVGEDVLLSHLLIPDKQWTLLSIVPQATLTAPMRAIERTGAALLLACLLLIALFARLFLRKVVQPIRAVSDGFRDFQADRLDPGWRLAKTNAWVQIGELVGWFNAFLDTMQARRQIEAALRESEARWRFAIEGADDGLSDWDIPAGTVFYSKRWKSMFGFAEDEIGNGLDEWSKRVHPDDLASTTAAVQAHLAGKTPLYASEHRIRCKDGSWKWVLDRGLVVLRNAAGEPLRMISTYTDISRRRRAQAALESSLREKVALLKEVHHRVKNNLQVVTSLLRLEARRSTVPDTRAVLVEMQGRIRAMALLHESLYRSGNFAAVDLGAYLTQLATQAFRTQLAQVGAVRLELDLASVEVGMDQATACGLLVNELISNGLKHGFPDGRQGELRVELHALEGGAGLRLRVSDSGVGLPPDFDARRSRSLGLQLVADLAGQIGGTLSIESGPGAAFAITFRAEEPGPPVLAA